MSVSHVCFACCVDLGGETSSIIHVLCPTWPPPRVRGHPEDKQQVAVCSRSSQASWPLGWSRVTQATGLQGSPPERVSPWGASPVPGLE